MEIEPRWERRFHAAAAAPEAAPAPCDGAERSLDPAYVPANRVVQAIRSAVFTGVTLIGASTLVAATSLPGAADIAILVAWVVVIAGRAVLGQIWPAVAYRRIRYRVDTGGIVIRRGVFWRNVTTVPRARIQHTDVNRGPIARRYGLATLVVHTAGTVNATVSLDGLAVADALAIRDYLIAARSS